MEVYHRGINRQVEITGKEKVTYALGGFGKNVAYGLVSSYTLFYYNSVLGISAAFIGVLLMIARIFDAFNDPVMGVVVARTRSRHGKYKPWIFVGTVTNAIIMYAMFTVPAELSDGGMKMYVAITYFLCGITYTLSDIPYWSVIPAVTAAGRIREDMTLYARTLSGIGAALPMMIAMMLVVWLGGGDGQEGYRTGFSRLALIIAVVYVGLTMVTLRYLPRERREEQEGKGPTVRELLLALIHNDHAIMIAIVIILFNSAVYLTTNLAVYLFQYDVGDYSQYTVFMIISGVTQFGAMVVLYPVMRRKWSNRRIFQTGCLVGIAGYVIMVPFIFMRQLTMVQMLVPGICVSLANGIAYVLTTVFVAGAVDYGERQNGRRDESIVSSLQTLMVKLSSAFAVLIAGVGIDLISLDEGAVIQTAQTCAGLRTLFAVPSLVLMAAALIVFHNKKGLGDDDGI